MAFIRAAKADDIIDWKGAGFALCAPDDVEQVAARLVELVEETNAKFPAAMMALSDSEIPFAMDRGDAYLSGDGKHYRIEAS